MTTSPWPTEIRLSKDRRLLTVVWESGASDQLSAEYLRVWSPSAEVQGHAASQRKTVPGKRMVEILSIDQVGNYAVRLNFDDLHTTGLFTWDWLWKLAREEATLFGGYLAELDAKGLSRDKRA
jgi:DUF971 family protein